MGEGFVVESSYPGYVFLGWAAGKFETERKEKRPYYNMFVLSPVSDYSSEDYEASGYKAEKKKCGVPGRQLAHGAGGAGCAGAAG